jgi:hypothetical protein
LTNHLPGRVLRRVDLSTLEISKDSFTEYGYLQLPEYMGKMTQAIKTAKDSSEILALYRA